MASLPRIIACAACLPALAAAADPAMIELVMPDARVVMEINLDRMAASPLGQTMSAEMKGEFQSLRPDWQQPLMTFGGLDWSHYAQEVLFASAGNTGKDAPALIIVRGLLDPAWVESLNAFRGTKTAYMGVPMLVNGGGGVVAFLEGSIAVIGKDSDVKAALRRRGQNLPMSPVLAQGLASYEGQFDAWMVSSGGVTPSAKSPMGPSLKWLEHVDAFTGGVRMSPDFDLNFNMVMHTEKDVADMIAGLKWFAGVVNTQQKGALDADSIQYSAESNHLSVALQVPEQQLRAALQQRNMGASVRRPPAPRPPDVNNGLPEPPSGTIRVQSSAGDMGTVIVPVGRQ